MEKEEILPSEREIFNGILNEAFKKYDALEKINQEQALEIARLKEKIEKAIEYITTEQLYTNYQWGKSQYAKILKDLLEILGDKE